MARLITEERRVLTGNLHTIPDIHHLFRLHKCKWMARDPKTYSEEIVREFYASYAATLRGSIDKRSKPTAQDPLTSTMVRGFSVDISHATINRFLYGLGPDHIWALNTADFDCRWDTVQSGAFTRNTEQREALLLWLARHIIAYGERAEWVTTPRLGIRKATLNLVAKFFWLLVRNRVSPTKADNLLCRDAGVPIWHCDKLVHATGTLGIGLIRDEANVASPRRGPRVDVPENAYLVDAVEQMQGDDPARPAHNDDTPVSSSQAISLAPSLSRATPPSGDNVIPLARVQKLEAQMDTLLLYHIKPWMRKLIAESEKRVEKRMKAKTDQKVQTIHKWLNAFELRVLQRPAPTIDMSSFRTELASLRADVDVILAIPAVEPQAAPSALGDDTVLGTLFSGDDAEEKPEPVSARGKRHRSSRKTELMEEEKASKRQRKQEKKAQKASIIDEQLRQQSSREMVAGASSSILVSEVLPTVADDVSTTGGMVRPTNSTTEGVVTKDAGNIEGDPTIAVVESGKPDPPV
uniref:Integrase core domain containing protein n=1 Tax=Solanum tuberosum TaxID=4113 RepID=M1CNU5_SOLTU